MKWPTFDSVHKKKIQMWCLCNIAFTLDAAPHKDLM